jgi:hypothetical protein
MATSAGGKAEQAGDSASLEGLARVGLVAYGVVYLLVGWLALQIAWGASASKSADTSGALRTLAAQPFGKILLWLVALGLVALALWQASEAIWGYRNREAAKRIPKQATSGAKAVIYAALEVSAAWSRSARDRRAPSPSSTPVGARKCIVGAELRVRRRGHRATMIGV